MYPTSGKTFRGAQFNLKLFVRWKSFSRDESRAYRRVGQQPGAYEIININFLHRLTSAIAVLFAEPTGEFLIGSRTTGALNTRREYEKSQRGRSASKLALLFARETLLDTRAIANFKENVDRSLMKVGFEIAGGLERASIKENELK